MPHKNTQNKEVEELYKKYGPHILNYLKKGKFHFSKEDAEELLQETFEKVFFKIENVRKAQDQGAYIFTMAKNAARLRLKNNKIILITNAENYQSDDDGNKDSSLNMERELCLELCFDKVFNKEFNTQKEIETKKTFKACCKEIVKYKDLNEYQGQHGLKPLCWVIMLLIVEGWSDQKIATFLNKTYGATRQAMSRCRASMKENKNIQKCKDDC